MKVKQICLNCGSEWETEEPSEVWDEVHKKWIIVDPETCIDCSKDIEEI